MRKLVAIVISFALLAPACPPSPAPPTPDPVDAGVPSDAGASSVYVVACNALRGAGCDEGKPDNCALVMRKADEGRQIRGLDPACLAKQTTKAGVHSCGGAIACP